jgi:hypothetical protein
VRSALNLLLPGSMPRGIYSLQQIFLFFRFSPPKGQGRPSTPHLFSKKAKKLVRPAAEAD